MNISDYEPKDFFYFFEQISAIPHGSFNTKALENYCLDFAAKRGLPAERDAAGNILIRKDGTPGYETCDPVIIQGHLDMVCEKKLGSPIDMAKEPLRLQSDGEWIWAEDTTLGADDGVAVATMLALLNSRDIPHPPLECLMTTNEEVGLVGAEQLGITGFKGKYLINIDSSAEGIITAGCAGGVRMDVTIPLNMVPAAGLTAFRYQISGLLGGHSGEMIAFHRQNAIVLTGRFLNELSLKADFTVADILCDGKDNVIPPHCESVICCSKENAEELRKAAASVCESTYNGLSGWEPGMKQLFEEVPAPELTTDAAGTKKLIFTLVNFPNDIQTYDPDIPGAPVTSSNMGFIYLKNGKLVAGSMVRSGIDGERMVLANRITTFTEFLGGTCDATAPYPAWPYKEDSKLRTLMAETWEELYGNRPKIDVIHAGLECGILTGKLGDLDMVSIGPDHPGLHTPEEKLRIASVKHIWDLLLRVFEKMKP